MLSKAIAKLLLFLNAFSFLLFTVLIVGVLVVSMQTMRGDLMRNIPFEYRAYTDAIIYGGAVLLFVVNVLVHGFIALMGAFLYELERSRKALEELSLAPAAIAHGGTPRL